MHLHDQVDIRFIHQPGIHRQHCTLDDVGGGALHRGIDRGTLGILAALAVAGFDIGDIQAASEYGLHISLFTGLFTGLFHVSLHPRIACEVELHIVLRGGTIDTKLLGQAKGRHAIDQTKIDRLGAATLIIADLGQWYAEYFGGGGTVDVLTGCKGR